MSESLPRATIKEVARAAGVSTATVSRALNGRAYVAGATRRRVRAIAARLGYVANAAARALSTSRTLTIAVLHPNVTGEFLAELIAGIGRMARNHGYDLLISNSHDAREPAGNASRALRGRVDGVIAWAPDVRALRVSPYDLPTVMLTGHVVGDVNPPTHTLTVDNHAGAYLMVGHVLKLGHRRIATIAGPRSSRDAAERLRGYVDALRDAGIAASSRLIVRGDFSEISGYEATQRLLKMRQRPTAIFAANDSMAVGALSALGEAKLSVPGDVAVVGFDDIPTARFTNPPLTTIRADIGGMGERAVLRLLDVIDHPGRRPRQEMLPTSLVVRESCGAKAKATRP
ncbi:MAG: LacI family transcriptional regulator [Gemmatimonadota bacterium]|nr:LacI family transcriptional regulator [Gemmatimonadota bacterium]